jgi:peptidoglycan/LPS O-acetylase OafA/YrhL
MKYRPEIDGLRAFAVLAVIFCHAGFNFASGGFIGVDIFFVISGYLITTIVLTDISHKTFSLADFYENRARRILPALFFVIIICIPIFSLQLIPRDADSFFKSIGSMLALSSNIFFWREIGYFSSEAELKPLLHTWSLSLEEQFYIIYPLLLMLMWRFGKRQTERVLILLLAGSLIVSQMAVIYAPAANFYLLPSRAWELLLGGLCALNRTHLKAKISEYRASMLASTGLLLISISIIFFSSSTPHPSIYTAAPTIGTALILLFASNSSFSHRLLSQKYLVKIGTISYSAYLIHNPVFSSIRYSRIDEPNSFLMATAIVIILFLALISWKYIEQPFRSRQTISSRLAALALLLSLTLITAALSVHFHGAHPTGLPKKDFPLPATATFLINTNKYSLEAPKKTFAIWGDSFAGALADELGALLNRSNKSLTAHINMSCPSILGTIRNEEDRLPNFGTECVKLNQSIFQSLEIEKPDYVVLASDYSWYLAGLNASDEPVLLDSKNRDLAPVIHLPRNLAATVRKVLEIGSTPIVILPHPKNTGFEALLRTRAYLKDTLQTGLGTALHDSELLTRKLKNENTNPAILISTIDLFCPTHPTTCPPLIGLSNRRSFLWYDGSHLSPTGAKVVAYEIVRQASNENLN